jgi:peptide/nickel transport system ATP-binding protein
MNGKPILLDVKNLRTHFISREGTLRALNDVSFTLREGETLGVVGESGCGKTVTSLSILRIVPSNGRIVGGEILLAKDGGFVDLTKLDARSKEMRSIRGADIAMVFQEPMTSFSPVYTVGNQIGEVLKLHRNMNDEEARKATVELLTRVEMPQAEQQVDAYSFNLSGGMRQRAMIAMALACSPRLLIADEPTSALDVTIQAQVLDLIKDLQSRSGMAIMIVSHDLGVVAQMADSVMIMYLGDSMEYGPVDTIYHDAKHPYTRGLIKSVPRIRTREREQLVPILGNVPSLYERPTGCSFHTRCPSFMKGVCDVTEPLTVQIDPGHTVKCHLYAKERRA